MTSENEQEKRNIITEFTRRVHVSPFVTNFTQSELTTNVIIGKITKNK